MKNKCGKLWICLLALCLCLSACGLPNGGNSGEDRPQQFPNGSAIERQEDTFREINERGFVSTAASADSSFALSVSRSSYTYMRRMVSSGRLPVADSVRIEEFINYFDYAVDVPAEGDFASEARVFDCPWNSSSQLLRVTFQARDTSRAPVVNNLVFLADVSASMYGDDRIGLFKTALSYAAEGLGENDTVSLVTYAGASRVVFEGKRATDRDEILEEVQALSVGGNTAGYTAIEKAYGLAEKYYAAGGNNKVILFTDGDFNVGITDTDALGERIREEHDRGITFTAIGVGQGNLRDDRLEALAAAGGGSAYYLDNEREARRVFGEELIGTLTTVAYDAKAQVSFQPAQVSEYRLLGYDNRMLTGVEFEDAETVGGEIGSHRQVTALYEIRCSETCDPSAPYATARLRYRAAGDAEESAYTVAVRKGAPTDDDGFIACVAEYGLLLRKSAYAADANYASVLARLRALPDGDEHRREFRALVQSASRL